MAVAFDAKMTTGNADAGRCHQGDNVTSLSTTGMTVGASATLLLVVVSYSTTGTNVASGRTATWNGVSMTEEATIDVQASSNRERVSVWRLVSPATGNQTIALAWTNSADVYCTAVSFTGTDTTTGVETAHSATATNTTSITVTSDANGATVAGFCVDGADPTVNFTEIYSQAPLDPGGGASYQIGGTSNAHTFTGAGGTAQALAGVHVIESAAAAGQPTMRRWGGVPHLGQSWSY